MSYIHFDYANVEIAIDYQLTVVSMILSMEFENKLDIAHVFRTISSMSHIYLCYHNVWYRFLLRKIIIFLWNCVFFANNQIQKEPWLSTNTHESTIRAKNFTYILFRFIFIFMFFLSFSQLTYTYFIYLNFNHLYIINFYQTWAIILKRLSLKIILKFYSIRSISGIKHLNVIHPGLPWNYKIEGKTRAGTTTMQQNCAVRAMARNNQGQ